MKVLTPALVVIACFLAAPLAAQSTEVLHGDALVGVDELGRVRIAVDRSPKDGLVDEYFMFTADTRLDGPWSRRADNAIIVLQDGTLSLLTVPPRLAVSLALNDAEPHFLPKTRRTAMFSNDQGFELISNPAEGVPAVLADLTIDDPAGWPHAFEYDLLDPNSCTNDFDCTQGGSFSPSCGIFGCPKSPTGCNVSCAPPTFACCKCTSAGTASCRCRGCVPPRPRPGQEIP